MVVNRTIHYELSTADDLRRLVDDLSSIDAETVIVAFASSRQWQASDVELARLVAAARNSGKRLIAERDAGSTAERAVSIGFQDLAVVSDNSDPSASDTRTIRTGDDVPTASIPSQPEDAVPDTGLPEPGVEAVEESPDRFHSTADLATYNPLRDNAVVNLPARIGRSDKPEDEQPDERQIDASPPEPKPAAEPPPRRPQPISRPPRVAHVGAPATLAQAQPVGRFPVAGNPAPHAAEPDPAPSVAEGRRSWGMARISAAVLAPLMVIGLVAAIAIYMLPTATVTLVPREDAIAASLTYGVTTTSATFDIAIDPTPLSTTTRAEATREASGERYEAVGYASGTIQITNPLTSEVTIPAGTEIPGPNGVTYYTADDAHLSAADPYGSMSFGSGSAGIYAGVLGPDGNLDAGALTGQLGNQMFYTNPGAISGGRLDRYTVITEEDVGAVRDEVARELSERAQEEFESEIPDGFEIIPGTLEIGDPEIEISGSAGDDGEQVSASGSVTTRAQLYDPEELHQLASAEADRQLARQGGGDRILLAETVNLKDPTDLESDQPAFQIDVEAIARTMITEAEKEALIAELVGLDRTEAEQVLAQHPKVDKYEIVIEPDWLLNRMPEISSRIEVRVSSSEPTASR